MQMTTDARTWLDATVARILSRRTLKEPERSGVHFELMSHLHAAAERKAQEQGAAEVATPHLEAALAEMGGEPALVEAFVAPHARDLPRAGFWKRALAYLIDFIVLSITANVVFGLLFAPLFFAQMGARGGGFDPFEPFDFFEGMDYLGPAGFTFAFVSGALWLVASVGYHAWFESTRQQTLGKMALRLRVVRTDGAPITTREAIIRNVVKAHPGIVLLDALAMVLFLRDERQRISDRVAETAVLAEG